MVTSASEQVVATLAPLALETAPGFAPPQHGIVLLCGSPCNKFSCKHRSWLSSSFVWLFVIQPAENTGEQSLGTLDVLAFIPTLGWKVTPLHPSSSSGTPRHFNTCGMHDQMNTTAPLPNHNLLGT